MSSLAVQLAQSASLNVALLADRSKRKPSESYLFTGREADCHDLDSLHALGTNAFLKLCSVDQRLMQFERDLFSERTRALDRTLLTREEDERLGGLIGQFLGLLGPWLLEAPTAQVIEWLVRRLRINEFNVESLLALFLPYHDTPQFAKLVTILHIKAGSTWSFLLPFKSAAQNVPRISLVTEMLRNADVARFVTSLLPLALKESRSHRVLLAFNAATLHEFISRSKTLSEGTMADILPAILEPLEKRHEAARDATLGSFILLSALAHKCQLSESALKVVLDSMASCASVVATKQFISAAVAICEPQTELGSLSGSTVKAILQLTDFKEELKAAVNWVGSEKLLHPLATSLVSRISDGAALALLESMISTPAVPSSVVEHAAGLLIREALSRTTEEKATISRALLSIIQQRHPSAFQSIIKAKQDEDEKFSQAIGQFILSLSTVSSASFGSNDRADIILASMSADDNLRLIAVRELLSSLSSDSLTSVDKGPIVSALISRIEDPDQRILEALYEKPDLVTPLFATGAAAYIQRLSSSLGLKPKRSLLRLHLTFVLGKLYPTLEPKLKSQVISDILFPFLLFSKPRQHTAEAVWDLVAGTIGNRTEKEFGILEGCADVVQAERGKTGDDAIEKMKSINAALSAQIAQNILMSNQLFELLPILLSKLESTNPHTRALGYLVAKVLLSKLSGQHQVDVAKRVLDVMDLGDIGGIDDFLEHDQFLENLKEVPEKNVVLKPTKQTTLTWLQVSVIASICTIPFPSGPLLDWMSGQPSGFVVDNRGPHYVSLMRDVYSLVNRSPSLPILTSCLLRLFYLNLESDTLAFLAGVWTSGTSSISKDNSSTLQEIALHHAAALLEAHVLEDAGVDFQTVVPALLIALQHAASSVRKTAIECLRRIRLIGERKLKSVYKFDVIYGDVKDTLHYLEQNHLQRYLAFLVSREQHFIHDSTYLCVAHAEHLNSVKGDKKKNVEYKCSVLDYLLSHVNGLTLDSAKVKVLESLNLVSSNVKALGLLPAIEALRNNHNDVTLAVLLVSSLDASSITQLNDPESGLWEIYTQILRVYLQPSSDSVPREILIRILETEVFSKLVHDKRVAVCQMVIGVVARDIDSQAYGKRLLANIIKDVPLMVELLTIHGPTAQGISPRAAKRAKATKSVDGDEVLAELSLLAEILGSKPLPGSLDLISALLETLGKLVQSSPASQVDVNYVEQMLMSAIDNAASNIPECPNVAPSVIRLDILVEVIRVVENPQTFHQALLLIASLSRLAPKSVLHNVMPVFTFMGSNVFHRDDTYSFRVVQKTIDGIVPVMASSLKDTYADTLDLYIASSDFLRVFTDAANHIPRHRRNNFFIHLVDVMGVERFLAPVCMLLVEKVTNRIARQNQEEVSYALGLPVTLLQHVSPSIQVSAFVEFLNESQRLVTCATNPTDHTPTFLGRIIDDPAVPAGTYFKRAQALVTLIGQGIQPNTLADLDDSGKELSGILVSGLTVLASSSTPEGLASVAQKALSKVLSAMPATDFLQAVVSMLASDKTNINLGALDLLSERIPKIADHVRRKLTTIADNIVGSTVKLLAQDSSVSLRAHCLRALKVISSTLVQQEESALTAALPAILATLRVPDLVFPALDVIIPLSTKLGPRIIPFFKEIVAATVTILKDANDVLLEKTTAVLHSLLASIPAFWGSDTLSQITDLYMDHCRDNSGQSRPAMNLLIKSIAKKVPDKVLPTLINVWSGVASSQNLDRITALSYFLARTLHHAPRTSVLEHIRSLSNIFLQGFDVVKVFSSAKSKAEVQMTLAFREFVVKLNESTFRPLFRRLYDWAFVREPADDARKIIFFRAYCDLLDFFKALMVPYAAILIRTLDSHLKSFAESSDGTLSLWVPLITTLNKTLSYDDGGFWRDDKLQQMAPLLVQQVPRCTQYPEARSLLQQCLDALVEVVSDDNLLKIINLDLLMHTRSENVRVCQFALVCSESLWRAHGGKLIGFAAETATFIAECGENENDSIVKESFRLKEAVECVAGKVDGL